MRKMAIALALLALFAPGALAVSRDEAVEIARDAANGAKPVRVERDGGVYEIALRDVGARYEVDVLDAGGAVLEIETEIPGAGGGRAFERSEEEARSDAAAVAPEAADGFVVPERGADGSVYRVFYASDGAVGEVEVNAQTGAVVRARSYPEAAARGVMDAARAVERVEERLPGARIAELELSWDDGRYVYEGEARSDGRDYSFELDAQTGAILELERDD